MTDTQQPRFIVSKSTPDYAGYDLEVSTGTGLSDDTRGIRAAWRIDGATSDHEALGALLSSLGYGAVMNRITITRLIPREPTADERLDAARNVLRADYWSDVRNVVDDVKDEIANGNLTDRDDVTEHIDERVDNHQRVIYTGQAIECLLFSDNDTAFEDEMGDEAENWSQRAYFAFRADIMDTIGDLDALLLDNAKQCYFCDVDFTDDDERDEYEDSHGVNHAIHATCPDEIDDETNDDKKPQ